MGKLRARHGRCAPATIFGTWFGGRAEGIEQVLEMSGFLPTAKNLQALKISVSVESDLPVLERDVVGVASDCQGLYAGGCTVADHLCASTEGARKEPVAHVRFVQRVVGPPEMHSEIVCEWILVGDNCDANSRLVQLQRVNVD